MIIQRQLLGRVKLLMRKPINTKRKRRNVKSAQQDIDITAAQLVASKAAQLPTIEAGGFIKTDEAFKLNQPKVRIIETKEKEN